MTNNSKRRSATIGRCPLGAACPGSCRHCAHISLSNESKPHGVIYFGGVFEGERRLLRPPMRMVEGREGRKKPELHLSHVKIGFFPPCPTFSLLIRFTGLGTKARASRR